LPRQVCHAAAEGASMRRKRNPSGEELELWRKVTDTVTPLAPAPRRKKPAATAEAEPKKPPPPPAPRKKERKAPAVAAVPKQPPGPPAPPPLHPIDRRTRTRLTRGAIAIDRRIDLHGMTQAAAEQRLKQFLADAQASGAMVVLVITGKGKTTRGY